jgi:hypothetical protein
LKVGLNTTKQTNKQKHITTKVGSLNPAHREVYLIQYFVIKFVIGDLSRFWWSYLGPLVYLLAKLLNYLAFQPFDFERTWWRLFQKRIVRTKFDIYVLLSVNCDRSVVFIRVLWFLPPVKLTAKICLKYCWKLR